MRIGAFAFSDGKRGVIPSSNSWDKFAWQQQGDKVKHVSTTIYLDDGRQREGVIWDVVQIEAERDGFVLVTLFGEQKFIKGKLRTIDFLKEHSVIIENEKS
ncbi:MAG: CooT family nickel-binding protein [Dehalococcoidia bacterium]|nr:MAG: CooT family nickel-binding protein [Dehalococcoidia bacterium]